MRHCYWCDGEIRGVAYRRWVPSGYSEGVFVSRRSYGASSRAYTGLRTLCERCAREHDAAAERSQIGGFLVLGAVLAVILLVMVSTEREKAAKAAYFKSPEYAQLLRDHPDGATALLTKREVAERDAKDHARMEREARLAAEPYRPAPL